MMRSQIPTVSLEVVMLSFRIMTASLPFEFNIPIKTNGASGSWILAIILSSDSSKNTSTHKSYLFLGQSNLLKVGSTPVPSKSICCVSIDYMKLYSHTNYYKILKIKNWEWNIFIRICTWLISIGSCNLSDDRIEAGNQNQKTNYFLHWFLDHCKYSERQPE